MNPKALGFYWFMSTAIIAIALAAPHLMWIALAVFFIYFIYSIV